MKVNYNGKNIEVSVIGRFKINDNEYMVCDYIEKDNSKIVIFQVVSEDGKIFVKDIPFDERELVISTYMKIQNNLLGEC